MRIVTSSEGEKASDKLSAHFGRCPYFFVFETDGKEIKSEEMVKNPHYEKHMPFAVPDFVMSLKPDIIITAGMGPRALEYFDMKEVKVINANGNNRECAGKYVKGELEDSENTCDH